MTDDNVAALQASIEGRDRQIATMEAEMGKSCYPTSMIETLKETAKVFSIILSIITGILILAGSIQSNSEDGVCIAVVLLAGGLTGVWMKWRR
jgi:fructose-specific phosphotransferase system component IIB